MSEMNGKCRICGKTIVGESKFGVCPACMNKHGTRALIALGVLGTGAAYVAKNGGKILRF